MARAEAVVESYLGSEVKKLGGESIKWKGTQGETDRIVFLPRGVIWFVEVKTLKGKLQPNQVRFAKRLSIVGANVTSVHGKDGVDKFIKMVSGNEIK